MQNYLNSNGLDNGFIPAYTVCPWNKNCENITSKCPKEGKIISHKYMCAHARFFSLKDLLRKKNEP